MSSNIEQPPEGKKKIKRSDAPLTAAEQQRRRERRDLANAVFEHMQRLNRTLGDFDAATFQQARDEVFRSRHVGTTGTDAERRAEFMRETKAIKAMVIKRWHGLKKLAAEQKLPPFDALRWLKDAAGLQGREQKRAGQTYKESGLVEERDTDVFTADDEEQSDNLE